VRPDARQPFLKACLGISLRRVIRPRRQGRGKRRDHGSPSNDSSHPGGTSHAVVAVVRSQAFL
jgi:hypothetical protein